MRTNSKSLFLPWLLVFAAFAFVVAGFAQSGSKIERAANAIDTPCQNISLEPPNRSFTAEGGSTFINVDHESNCTFTATSNSKWITVTSVQNSNYGGTVYYTVSSHSDTTSRSGTISVGGQNFTINQIPGPLQGAPTIMWTGASHTAGANALVFSPDGRLLASASDDHTVKVWRVADGALLRTLSGFYDRVTSVAFSHNGQKLAAGSIDRNVRVWNVVDWSLVRSAGTGDFILGVAFSPNDTELAAAGGYSGNWIHIFQTSDWQETGLLGYGQEENPSIAYSNNGQFLAWAMAYPGVRLQNVATGSYCMLEGSDYYGMNAVAFSPDSQQIASGSDSQEVGVWHVGSCGRLLSLNGPSGFVKSVAYSPDGQMILAGGQDYPASHGALLFWRVADGALLRVYVGQTSTAVLSVQFSPRGNFYAYACADGRVVVARNPFMSDSPRQ